MQNIFTTLFVLLICFFMVMSYARTEVWFDEYNLFGDITKKSGLKARAHTNLSIHAYRKGNFDLAFKEAEKSIKRYYYHPDAHYIVGLIYYKRGRYAESIKAYKWALLLIEKYSNDSEYLREVHNSLGLSYEAVGEYSLAEIEFYKSNKYPLYYEKR